MKKNIISFLLSITFFIFISCKTTDIIPGSNRIKIQNIYNEYLNIANVYYVDNLSENMMIMNNAELIEYKNKVLIWARQ